MEFVNTALIAPAMFGARQLTCLQMWWGYWLVCRGNAIRVARPLARRIHRARHGGGPVFLAGLQAPIVEVPPPSGAFGYTVGPYRFPAQSIDLIREHYPSAQWRRIGEGLLAFVGRVPVGAVTCFTPGVWRAARLTDPVAL